MEEIKISERERMCLKHLVNLSDVEENCTFFRHIAKDVKLEEWQVKRAVRGLARKGLAELVRGLIQIGGENEGMLAGSGYCATREGVKFIRD